MKHGRVLKGSRAVCGGFVQFGGLCASVRSRNSP